MLTLNTQILFKLLTKAMQPHSVLDIGSMDGSDALMLKKLSPETKCFAFEANPYNFESMKNDPKLFANEINIINKAVADHNGSMSFFIAQQDGGSNDWRKGTSSLLKRSVVTQDLEEIEIKVDSITLNSFLEQNSLDKCAIWVDVEGAAYQVLKGADLVASHILMGHVEVEGNPIWADQRDANTVVDLLSELGFCAIARGGGKNQHDIVFVRKEIADKLSLKYLLCVSFFVSKIRKYLGKFISTPLFLSVLQITPRGFIRTE